MLGDSAESTRHRPPPVEAIEESSGERLGTQRLGVGPSHDKGKDEDRVADPVHEEDFVSSLFVADDLASMAGGTAASMATGPNEEIA